MRLNLLFFGACFTVCLLSAKHDYKAELDSYVNKMQGHLIFDKDANIGLRMLEADIENIKHLSFFHRILLFFAKGGIVVTKGTMPKLHDYIKSLCDRNNLKLPTLFITMNSSVLNAYAAKLLSSAGGIVIDQKLLADCSDEEIEAVVAHEVGHIAYNHSNKSLGGILIFCFIFHMLKPKTMHRLPAFYQGYTGATFGRIAAGLVIGKKFEKQADAFACEQGNAAGLISFFERMLQLEEKKSRDFIAIKERIEQSDIGFIDRLIFLNKYKGARFIYYLNKALSWIYHHTPFGSHPSPRSRIESAQNYLKSQ